MGVFFYDKLHQYSRAYKAQFVMGDDWKGKFDELGCKYIPRTKGISSTELKKVNK